MNSFGDGPYSTVTHLHYLVVRGKVDTRKIRKKIEDYGKPYSTGFDEDLGCKVDKHYRSVGRFGKPDIKFEISKPIEPDFDYSLLEAKLMLGRRELYYDSLLYPESEDENPIQYFHCCGKDIAKEAIFDFLKEEFNIKPKDVEEVRVRAEFETPPEWHIGHNFVKNMEKFIQRVGFK